MQRSLRTGAATVMLGLMLLLVSGVSAAGEKYVTYGADTTPAERAELGQLFGVSADAKTDTVATPEMVAALQGTGLPAAPTDKSISSSVLTCLNKGDGLRVRTQNITRVTAQMYANAMVTAGIGDADVLIAAPKTNPVTGETALVGVLKSYPQCQAGKKPEDARVRLAYEQIARTVALAGQSGDLNKASTVMLQTAQPVITGQAKDDPSIGQALDSAAGAAGLSVAAAQRPDLVAFFKRLSGADYGAYAKGYQAQQVSPTEVKIAPAGAGAPGNAAPGAAASATGTTFSGEVKDTGNALTVNSNGRDQRVAAGPNLTVTRDGKSAQLKDLKKGDTVTVATNPDGSAQRIDATSHGSGGGIWQWLLPLLLALVLLAALLWFFLGRRKKGSFVLEGSASSGAGAVTPPKDDSFTVEPDDPNKPRR